MPRKRPSAAEISAKLHQVDLEKLRGKSVPEAIRIVGMTAVTYYRWRKQYADHIKFQVREMKILQKENARLCRVVSDLTLALERMIQMGSQKESSEPGASPRLPS